MTAWFELFTVLGSFVGAAFALIRYTMSQHRAMTDRFVTFLEGSLRRQEEINSGFRRALEDLTENVRENSSLLGRLAERVLNWENPDRIPS
jgi:hypothetical protein